MAVVKVFCGGGNTAKQKQGQSSSFLDLRKDVGDDSSLDVAVNETPRRQVVVSWSNERCKPLAGRKRLEF
jgi:hypothetical protein